VKHRSCGHRRHGPRAATGGIWRLAVADPRMAASHTRPPTGAYARPPRSQLARAATDEISRAAAMESRAAIDVPAQWRGGHRRHHLGGVRLRCLGHGARRRCHLVPERRGRGSCCRQHGVSHRRASRQSQRSVRSCRNRHQPAAQVPVPAPPRPSTCAPRRLRGHASLRSSVKFLHFGPF